MLILDRDTIPPNAQYCDADVAYILLYLREHGHTSRKDLLIYLGLGEGSFRSLVGIMKASKLIMTSKKGMTLDFNGECLVKSLRIHPVEVGIKSSLGTYRQAIKVIRPVKKVTDGVDQVRMSTMFGGVGCSTWVMSEHNSLLMPPSLDYSIANLDESKRIIDVADMHPGDVLLVCGADTERSARVAAMMVALDLI